MPQSVRLSLRCARCGDVIGAYEPMVVVIDEVARLTSAAAEPEAAEAPGERFHDACFLPRVALDQAG